MTSRQRPFVFLSLFVFALSAISVTHGQAMRRYTVETVATVNAVVRQSDGKVIIGGLFEYVNGQPRANLARLNSDGTLDPVWVANANGSVNALAVSGTNIFAGGVFSTINNIPAPRVARLGFVTGAPAAGWTNNIQGTVFSLLTDGTNVYAGSNGTNVNDVIRPHLAKFDLAGIVDPTFTNGPNSVVRALALYSNVLWVGGSYTVFSDVPRTNLAAVNSSTGNPLAAGALGASSTILSLQVYSNDLYAAGSFSFLVGNAQVGVGRLHAFTGAFDASFTSDYNSVVCIAVEGTNLYVGGSFTNVGGTPRSAVTKARLSDGAPAVAWTNGADSFVLALFVTNNHVWAGGQFSHIGTADVFAIARLNFTNGLADTDFNARAMNGGSVFTMAKDSLGQIVLGGDMDVLEDTVVHNAARLLENGDIDVTWRPNIDADVLAVSLSTSGVYVGGNFTNINGAVHRGIARLNPTGALPEAAWTATANTNVTALFAGTSSVYAGGAFTNIGGSNRLYLARLDPITGIPHGGFNVPVTNSTSFTSPVFTLLQNGTSLYVGGKFTAIAGLGRTNIASLNATNGVPYPTFIGGGNSDVWAVALLGTNLIVAGNFTNLDGTVVRRVAKVDAINGLVDFTWTNGPTTRALAVEPVDGGIMVGGVFLNYGSANRQGLAKLDATTGNPEAFWTNQVSGGTDVRALKAHRGNIYVGGTFDQVNGTNSPGLFRTSLYGDSDEDGLPDSWELQYFGNVTNALPTGQGDDDGVNNLDEFVADTIPTNGSSYFGLSAITGSATTVLATLPTSSTRVYSVQVNTNLLVDSGWTNRPDLLEVPGTGGALSLTDSNAPPLRAYRASVRLP